MHIDTFSQPIMLAWLKRHESCKAVGYHIDGDNNTTDVNGFDKVRYLLFKDRTEMEVGLH